MTGTHTVTRDYRSVFRSRPIAFSEGDTVDVDDETAGWVNNDSPGCLVPVDKPDAPTSGRESIEVEPGETGEHVDGNPDGVDDGPVVQLDDLDRDQLLAFAVEHGIEVDRRLGEAKLREAISAAPLPPVDVGSD